MRTRSATDGGRCSAKHRKDGIVNRVLAYDLGASSGRAMLGELRDGRIHMEELLRFPNDPVYVRRTLYWDVLRLYYNIKEGISQAVRRGGFASLGIDTWGVDFGLIRKEGQLVGNPVHYRDNRTDDYDECLVTPEEAYDATGIEVVYFNTLYQLNALARKHPRILADADHVLLMPDLFNFMLCGEKKAEYTIASTTAMLDARTRQWDEAIIRKAGIPEHLMCEVVYPGTLCGLLTTDICNELGCEAASVLCIASHDTASAVAATPTQEKDFIFMSCGTWCLLGTVLDEPLINDRTRRYNFTNEGTVGGKIQFLKNIMGTWLIQESRRQWRREGSNYSFADLEELAILAEPFRCFIDPDAPEFSKPGDLPRRIREYCERTGQKIPESAGAVVRCIDESLAFKFRSTIEKLEDCTGKSYDSVNIMGGGAQSRLLCRMTAEATGREVIAGPVEATALGNVGVQLLYHKELADLSELRSVVAETSELDHYVPHEPERWNEAYRRYQDAVSREEA